MSVKQCRQLRQHLFTHIECSAGSPVLCCKLQLKCQPVLAPEGQPVTLLRVDLRCRAYGVVSVPAELCGLDSVHAGETFRQCDRVSRSARLKVVHHQPGLLTVLPPTHRLRNTQGICCSQRLQALGFGNKHIQLFSPVQFDEPGLLPGTYVAGLINRAPSDRAWCKQL